MGQDYPDLQACWWGMNLLLCIKVDEIPLLPALPYRTQSKGCSKYLSSLGKHGIILPVYVLVYDLTKVLRRTNTYLFLHLRIYF